MKAIIYTQYGPPEVLQLKELAKPASEGDQVLVKVHAASINALDYRRFEGVSTLGRLMDEKLVKTINKVPGADIAGQVEAVGPDVTQFRPGDQVFGVSTGSIGGFAEYACALEKSLALKPARLSFEAAAALPVAGVTALQALRDKGHIQPGQKVLINGASGGVGTFAVQLAKFFQTEVTAVCSSRNLEMARSLGADHVIDYTNEDFTHHEQQYDLIIAVNGYRPISDYRRRLRPEGRYIALGGSLGQILQGMLLGPVISSLGGRKMSFMGISKVNHKDLVFMASLLEAGKVTPFIDRSYPLSEVAEAIRYVVMEHARGKVVISMGSTTTSDPVFP